MVGMSLTVTQYMVGGYDDNFSYLLTDSETKQTFYVDPCGTVDVVLHAIQKNDLTLTGIIITHTHHDHIDGLTAVLANYNVPVYVHTLGQNRIDAPHKEILHDNDRLPIGESELTVWHTPGHLDDSVCLSTQKTNDGAPALISGDTLFVRGCGRTTKNDVYDLYESLLRIKTLPPETIIYPGHNYGPTPTSILSEELLENQYLTAPNFEAFLKRRLD